MGAPNIQQQLYLKKALNENTDGMFDHPEVQNEETITEGLMGKIKSIGLAEDTITEGYHKKAMRAAGTPKFWDLDTRATASELRRGGASKRTMKKYFNKDEGDAGSRARAKFEKNARAKRKAALGSEDARISTHATKMDAKRKAARIAEDTITEGSLGSAKIGKGKKFNPEKYRNYSTKTAVRQLISRGKDPNKIKFPGTQGLENYGFHVNADVKRKAALKAKGLLPEPKPVSPESLAAARSLGRKVRHRKGIR